MIFDAQQSVFELIRLSFPSSMEEQTLLNYKTYLFRILNLRTKFTQIESRTIEKEIESVNDKMLAKRLEESITKLGKSKIQNNQLILHFLFRVGELGRADHSNICKTVFTDSNITKQKSSTEIENTQTANRTITKSDNNLIKSIIIEKQNSITGINDVDLMKDLLFCLQGIEGQYITYDASLDSFALRKEVSVSISTRQLVNILSECGWLFKRISQFCQLQQSSLIIQALQSAIKLELVEYYRLIAYFEGLIQSEQLISIKRMYMWLQQPYGSMNQISQVLSIISTNTPLGCTSALILNTLHHFCKHGCPVVSELFFRLQHASCQPLIKYINQWIFEGNQNDISKEFFIDRYDNSLPLKDQGEMWVKQYKLNYDKIPSMISFEDAYKIFDTGRAINWLRKQCELRNWSLSLPPLSISMLQTNGLTQFVNQANTETNSQLVRLLFEKFHLMNHFQSVKQYLLLGNGNFAQVLIETLYQELSKNAHIVYKHTLTGLVETALRASNAPNIIQQRLAVKLLEPSKNDVGWDIFCLDYDFTEPLNTIFNYRARINYQKIFNYLWRIKRVEYTLIQCWSQQVNVKYRTQPNSIVNRALNLSLQLMNEMLHFIKNFFSYIMLEAVETPFKRMIDQIEKIDNLDNLIQVHDKFQQEVLDKVFLTEKSEGIQEILLKIFEVSQRYKQNLEYLLLYVRDVISQDRNDKYQQSLNSIIQSKTTSVKDSQESFKGQEIVQLLLEVRNFYRKQMIELIKYIQKEDKLKFLLFKLDFNEYYFTLQEERIFANGFEKFLSQCIPQQIKESFNSQKVISNKPLQKEQQSLLVGYPSSQKSMTAIQQDFVQIKEGIKMLEDQKKKQYPQPQEQQKDYLKLPPKAPIPTVQQQSPGLQLSSPSLNVTRNPSQPQIFESKIPQQQSMNQLMQQFQLQQQQLQQLKHSSSQSSIHSQKQYVDNSQQFLQTQQSYLQQSNIGPSIPFSHQSQSQISIHQDNLLMSQDENILQMMDQKYQDDDSSDEDLI